MPCFLTLSTESSEVRAEPQKRNTPENEHVVLALEYHSTPGLFWEDIQGGPPVRLEPRRDGTWQTGHQHRLVLYKHTASCIKYAAFANWEEELPLPLALIENKERKPRSSHHGNQWVLQWRQHQGKAHQMQRFFPDLYDSSSSSPCSIFLFLSMHRPRRRHESSE